jgi:hypothetical protein
MIWRYRFAQRLMKRPWALLVRMYQNWDAIHVAARCPRVPDASQVARVCDCPCEFCRHGHKPLPLYRVGWKTDQQRAAGEDSSR